MTIKCPCQECGVNIEFDVMQAEELVNCPACGKPTRLTPAFSKSGQLYEAQPDVNADGDSAISTALTIFAWLDFIGGAFGGLIIGQSNPPLGFGIFSAGILGGLILLGFASIIEHTKASAERLKRIEKILTKTKGE